MRTFDRRLAQACAAALALFTPPGFGQEELKGRPQADATGYTPQNVEGPITPLELALQRVKQDLKPAVVIVVPADAAASATLAAQLTDVLANSRSRQARALDFLLAEAVFVCAPAAQVRNTFPTAPPKAAVLLVDQNGKVADSLADGPGLFQEGCVQALTELLHGRKGERLAAAARIQRRSLGDLAGRIDDAVRDLDSDHFRKREAASGFLAGSAERSTAVLIQAHLKTPSLEARRRLERLLDGVLASATWQFGSTLPYGVQWGEAPTDGCPGNGPPNAFRALAGQRYLRFVAEMRPPGPPAQ